MYIFVNPADELYLHSSSRLKYRNRPKNGNLNEALENLLLMLILYSGPLSEQVSVALQ